MKRSCNLSLLKAEQELAQERSKLRAELEERVETCLDAQMEPVCAWMQPKLIACWENGGLGEEISEEVFISLPKEPFSQMYRDLLNAIVREKLEEYGFIAYFDCGKEEEPNIAKVHFNFTQAFYGKKENWCHWVAQKYLAKKISETAVTLYQFIDLQLLSMKPKTCYKGQVRVTVKLPFAARKIVAKGVCNKIPRGIAKWSLNGKDQIVFNVKVSM